MTAAMEKWTPQVLSLLRIVTAVVFLQHPLAKLFGFPPAMPNLPPLTSIFGIAGLIEIVLTPFLLIGLFTRPVAFLLSGEMAIAYFYSHNPRAVYPIINGGEQAILFCFIFLLFAVAGGGAWSVDRAFRGEK